MFVNEAWYVGAWSDEVGSSPLARTLLEQPIVFVRLGAGPPVALEDRCPHRGLPLSRGEVIDGALQCGYHGIQFDGTGRCLRVPGQAHTPEALRVRSYPVVEKNELIWIWMGAPETQARADPALIPDFPWHDGRDVWPHRVHVQNVACHYQLVIDNLLDLTHLAFVHKSTIGGDPDAHTRAEFNIENTPRGVRFIRWLLNSAPPPLYGKQVGFAGRIDRWMEFEYVAPGAVLQFTGAVDANTGAYDRGVRDGGFALRIFHNVTPETADRCWYFWSACHGHRRDDATITEALFVGVKTAFKEDESILEAQHRSLKRKAAPLYGTKHDSARVRADRVLNDMLEAERANESTARTPSAQGVNA